jgi:hypothetical protein
MQVLKIFHRSEAASDSASSSMTDDEAGIRIGMKRNG